MAISVTSLTAGATLTTSTSNNTASVSPTANYLVLVSVFTYDLVNGNVTPSGVSGAGLTFSQYGSTLAVGTAESLSLWYAMSASPSSGALAITYGAAPTALGWTVDEVAGVVTTGTNGVDAIRQSASNAAAPGATPSATLSAFGSSNNGTYGAAGFIVGNLDATTTTEGSGFTRYSYSDFTGGGGRLINNSEARTTNSTTVACTYSQAGFAGIIGVELVVPSAVPVFLNQYRHRRL